MSVLIPITKVLLLISVIFILVKYLLNKYQALYFENIVKIILNIQKYIEEKKPKQPDKNCKNLNDYNLLIVTNDIPEFKCKKGDCFITYYTD